MKIERDFDLEKLFKDLEEGEIFSAYNNYFMKIESIFEYDENIGESNEYNFVNLETGVCGYFDEGTLVNPLPDAVLKLKIS